MIAVRAVHYGATIVLFGEMVFALVISGRPTYEQGAPLAKGSGDSSCRRFRRMAVAAWALMVISGAGWLALVTAQMSGVSLGAITASGTATVLRSTVFGQSWSVRALMALALPIFWLILRTGQPWGRWAPLLSLGATSGLLAGLAWAGHANAAVGVNGWIHHASDAAHLIAAGLWLGGLAPLATMLTAISRSPTNWEIDRGAALVERFGNWAALSVGAIVLTGIANAYYLVPAPAALLETAYGNVLLTKLFVFALMLAIAAVNRTRLTTALRATERDEGVRANAVKRLRRNVLVEQTLGAGVVLLVATLGVTPPPMRM